jgi:hypothetical protein
VQLNGGARYEREEGDMEVACIKIGMAGSLA